MNWVLIGVVLFQAMLFAEEMEVRSYAVGQGALERAYWQFEGNRFDRDREDVENPWGTIVRKMPFESQFLKGVKLGMNCSETVGKLIGRKDFKGEAIYDLKGERLVVRADWREHEAIAGELEVQFPKLIQTEVNIYSVLGVERGKRAMFWGQAPKGAEMLGSVSCVHLPGVAFLATGGSGGLVMKGEAHINGEDDYLDSRVTLVASFGELNFSWETGFMSALGMPYLHEVGSLDSERSVVAVMRHDLVRPDGGLMDRWILKEEGAAFLRAERLNRLSQGRKSISSLGGEEGVRVYSVPPTFEIFMNTSGDGVDADDDPFAVGPQREVKNAPIYQGDHPELKRVGLIGLYDFESLLKKNGISFREGDFAVFKRNENKLYAKLSEIQFELLDGITNGGGFDPSNLRWIRIDFSQMEMEGEKLFKKAGISVLPGQTGKVSFGEDLAFEVEVQIDGNNDIVDMRAVLSEVGKNLEKPSFKTGLILRDGATVKIHESGEGEKQMAWVVSAHIVTMGELVAEYLKEMGE